MKKVSVLSPCYNVAKYLPKYLEKNQKGFEIFLVVFQCIIFPIVSTLITFAGEQRLVSKSLSYIAYRENHMGLIYFYGLLFAIGFFLSLIMCLDAGQYSKQMKITFITITAISCVVLGIGISVPWVDGEGDTVEKFAKLRRIHNAVSTAGFILFFVVELLLFLTTAFRNGRQFLISAGIISFVLISSVFLIKEANLVGYETKVHCPVSAIAQIYLFCAIEFSMTVQYFLMRIMPNKRIPVEEESFKEN